MLYFERQELPLSGPDPNPSQNFGIATPVGAAGQITKEDSPDLALGELQGKWRQFAGSVNGEFLTQMLEFTGNRFALTILAADGSVRGLCQGHVRVQELNSYRIAIFSDFQGTRSAAAEPALNERWLYSVRDRVLTVARYFETRVSEKEPTVERYGRIE